MFKTLEYQHKFIEDINDGNFLPEYFSKTNNSKKNYDAKNLEIYSIKNKASILPRENMLPSRDVMAEEFNNANYMFAMNYDQTPGLSDKNIKNKQKLQLIKMGLIDKRRLTVKKPSIFSESKNISSLTKVSNFEESKTNLDDFEKEKKLNNLRIQVPKSQERDIWDQINDSLSFHEDLKKFTKSNINFLVFFIKNFYI